MRAKRILFHIRKRGRFVLHIFASIAIRQAMTSPSVQVLLHTLPPIISSSDLSRTSRCFKMLHEHGIEIMLQREVNLLSLSHLKSFISYLTREPTHRTLLVQDLVVTFTDAPPTTSKRATRRTLRSLHWLYLPTMSKSTENLSH